MKLKKWTFARAGLASAVLWGVLTGGTAGAQTPRAAGNAQATPTIAPDKPAATVNGQVITFGKLEPVLKMSGPLPVTLPEAQRKELQREALSILIDDLLLQQFLNKHVPPANPAEVKKKMTELTVALRERKQTLADLCRESNQTEEQIAANIANNLQWSAYANKHITDADLQKYWAEYRDFFDRVVVRASHIVLRVPLTATPSERAATRARLARLRDEIVSGKLDFAAAAKANSQCPTAPNGGDIGSFPRKFVVDEKFARAAFALKAGEVSDIVETDFGLHLIKVTERKPGEPSDFNKIKADVREIYMEDLRQTTLGRLRKEARIEIHLP